MRKEGIPFIERDVQNDPSARQEFSKLGVRGVPTFVIGKDVIAGFNKEEIVKKLDFFITVCGKCNKKMILPKNKGKVRATCPDCSNVEIVNTNR